MAEVVRFAGTTNQVVELARRLRGILAGRESDSQGIMRGFLSAIGFAALSDIKSAYITKARGGTDEMGIRWEPLAPATIANRRVGPRDRKVAKIAARERIRKRETKKALARYRLSLPEQEAQRRAAIVGGLAATRQTGETKVQALGNREVEILRDTSVLFNSLSPGEFRDGIRLPPTEEGSEHQIFEVDAGQIVVGTNVAYAGTHQNGSATVPARPFLPTDSNPVPNLWWSRWLRVANQALVAAAAEFFRRGGKR